jgi:hypothetical protein
MRLPCDAARGKLKIRVKSGHKPNQRSSWDGVRESRPLRTPGRVRQIIENTSSPEIIGEPISGHPETTRRKLCSRRVPEGRSVAEPTNCNQEENYPETPGPRRRQTRPRAVPGLLRPCLLVPAGAKPATRAWRGGDRVAQRGGQDGRRHKCPQPRPLFKRYGHSSDVRTPAFG